jgi:anaphase-promoting complex subunit 7
MFFLAKTTALLSWVQAVIILQSIPSKQRSPKISMALGKLYHQNGMERPAIAAYRWKE